MTAPTVGSTVRVAMSKWGGRPHWTFAGVLLGRDDHGDWIGHPVGTGFRRTGMEFHAPNDSLTLVPAPVDRVRPGWMAGCHGPGGRAWAKLDDQPTDVYVDMTTPAAWTADTVSAVDLDLDVIRGRTGRVILDDEDEFAEHQVTFGYPAEVIEAAEATATTILELLASGAAPFDRKTLDHWLGVLGAAGHEPIR